jgi:hypothetical protein
MNAEAAQDRAKTRTLEVAYEATERSAEAIIDNGRDIRRSAKKVDEEWYRTGELYEHLPCGKLMYQESISFHHCSTQKILSNHRQDSKSTERTLTVRRHNHSND